MGQEQEYNEGLFWFMQAYDDDDAPDGAWAAKLQDSVRFFNEANNTSYDEHDAWMAYISWSQDRLTDQEKDNDE